jgi:hypothetical protein
MHAAGMSRLIKACGGVACAAALNDDNGKCMGWLACAAQSNDDDGKGLVEMVMDLLGIDPNSIGEDDNLAGMGIDSMQARARLTRLPALLLLLLHHASSLSCCWDAVLPSVLACAASSLATM